MCRGAHHRSASTSPTGAFTPRAAPVSGAPQTIKSQLYSATNETLIHKALHKADKEQELKADKLNRRMKKATEQYRKKPSHRSMGPSGLCGRRNSSLGSSFADQVSLEDSPRDASGSRTLRE